MREDEGEARKEDPDDRTCGGGDAIVSRAGGRYPNALYGKESGAGGGGRTLMALRPRDFESRASASSATPAGK